MISTAGLLLEQCAGAFDPMVLAQLDAALAHELAADARRRADDAAERLEQQIRTGSAAANLADLAQYASAAKGTATKAQVQAAAATEVVLALGGALGRTAACTTDNPTGPTDNPTGPGTAAEGYDAAVVDKVDPAALVDVIARLEEVKNAAAAAQAQAEAVFVAQQQLVQARAGMPREKIGRGVAEQVALARHESPWRGRQLCGLAYVLVREMPLAMAAFGVGTLSEYRAGILARETACLSAGHRAAVDAMVCGDPERLASMGSRELAAAAKRAALSLDAAAVAKRFARAESERFVSLRPAADGMTLLTALVPLRQGVRIYNLLTKVADGAKAAGDERGKGQLMADALLHRLVSHTPCTEHSGGANATRGTDGTGGKLADAVAETSPPGRVRMCTTVSEPDLALQLVMTDRALFDGASDPALLVGYEPIPAPAARALVSGTGNNADDALTGGSNSEGGTRTGNDDGIGPSGGKRPGGGSPFSPRVWLKRLFTHPETNALLAMDSKGRLFPEGMKEFLRLRDQTCASPYCDAPIRDYDHIKSWAAGGETSVANGQGLCRACNQAKEAPGWTVTTGPGTPPPRTIPPGAAGSEGTAGPNGAAEPQTIVTTPTGHSYVSTAPPLPGPVGSQFSRLRTRRR
nr:HNH endonuclease signature motif containing protein [Arthrobacter wenxiniae]